LIEINIPGYGALKLEHLICDFSGTLSVDGKLLPGIRERLDKLSERLQIHILTSDTHGKAESELADIKGIVKILKDNDHDVQKESYLRGLNGMHVAAIGNGNNDARLLKSARIGIIVCMEEGCSSVALHAADVVVKSAADALDLLLYPNRLKATLRY
jgi:soluble P-type ATPase